MNIRRVYTPPIFIARGIDPWIGGMGAHNEYWTGVHPTNIQRKGYRPLDRGYREMGHAMNIGRVYTAPIFIARAIDTSTGGMGAHHEYWTGVHPSYIHREGCRPLNI